MCNIDILIYIYILYKLIIFINVCDCMYKYTELVNSCGRTQETLTISPNLYVLGVEVKHHFQCLVAWCCKTTSVSGSSKVPVRAPWWESDEIEGLQQRVCNVHQQEQSFPLHVCHMLLVWEKCIHREREREKDVFKQMNLMIWYDINSRHV